MSNGEKNGIRLKKIIEESFSTIYKKGSEKTQLLKEAFSEKF